MLVVAGSSLSIPFWGMDSKQPLFQGMSSDLKERIKSAVQHALGQLAVSMLFVVASACFAPSIVVVGMMSALALLSALLAVVVEVVINPKAKSFALEEEQKIFLDYLRATAFSTTSDLCRDTLIHESGHALAANLIFKGAQAKINVEAFSGSCQFYASARHLTSFGNCLGLNKALALVSAAGPLASLLTSSAFLTLAHFLPGRHHSLKAYLHMMTIQSVVRHAFYALSACFLTQASLGHDFYAIWMLAGVHPLVSTLCIVAMPIIVKLGLEWLRPSLREVSQPQLV
jgi:hypothetical protein